MSIPLSHRDGLRRQTSAFLGEGDTGDLPNDRLDDAGDLSDRDALLDLITIPPQNVHTATVIWLHVCPKLMINPQAIDWQLFLRVWGTAVEDCSLLRSI